MLFAPSGKGRKRQKKGEKGRFRPISGKGGQTPLKSPFVSSPFAAAQAKLEISRGYFSLLVFVPCLQPWNEKRFKRVSSCRGAGLASTFHCSENNKRPVNQGFKTSAEIGQDVFHALVLCPLGLALRSSLFSLESGLASELLFKEAHSELPKSTCQPNSSKQEFLLDPLDPCFTEFLWLCGSHCFSKDFEGSSTVERTERALPFSGFPLLFSPSKQLFGGS